MDERLLHEPRQSEALVQRVRAAVRAGVAAWGPHDGVGTGPSAHGRSAVPATAVARPSLALARRYAAHHAGGLPSACRQRRPRCAPPPLVAPRPQVQRYPDREIATLESAGRPETFRSAGEPDAEQRER